MYGFFSFRLKLVKNAAISKKQFFAKNSMGMKNAEFYADFKLALTQALKTPIKL